VDGLIIQHVHVSSDGEMNPCEAMRLPLQCMVNLFITVHTNDILWSKGGKATFPNFLFIVLL